MPASLASLYPGRVGHPELLHWLDLASPEGLCETPRPYPDFLENSSPSEEQEQEHIKVSNTCTGTALANVLQLTNILAKLARARGIIWLARHHLAATAHLTLAATSLHQQKQ